MTIAEMYAELESQTDEGIDVIDDLEIYTVEVEFTTQD